MKLSELTWEEFVKIYWPCQDGGSSYRGSEIVWADGDDCWHIEECYYDCVDVEDAGILIGAREPSLLWDALQKITSDSSGEEIEKIIYGVPNLLTQSAYIDDPKNSDYWSGVESMVDVFDDGDIPGYVWHRENGVLTDLGALEEMFAEREEE